MGNGKMLAYFSGVSIWSLHCEYSAPSVLSLSPDSQGGYYETESRRLPCSSVRRHMMWYTAEGIRTHSPGAAEQTCDLRLTDYMALREGICLRMMEGKAPLGWKISFPSYVRHALVRDYRLIHCEAEALFCTIPSGTPYGQGAVLTEEQSLTVYLCGDLHFESDGGLIRFSGTKGYILFIDSRNPAASLRTADQLIMQLNGRIDPSELPIFREAEHDWNTMLGPIEAAAEKRAVELYPSDAQSAERLAEKISDASAALLTMQSDGGVILTDQWHPYGSAVHLPLLTEAMLKLGCTERAGRMIGCWADQIGSNVVYEDAGIPAYLDGKQSPIGSGEVSCGLFNAAFLLAAVLYAEAADGQAPSEEADQLLRKMRKAFTMTVNALCNGMLPFSGSEACFENGVLSRDCIFHGSAVATAVAIAAADRYIAYCTRKGRKIARESERYLELLHFARAHFRDRFGGSALFHLNSPNLVEKSRRPRFLRGICPICSADAPFPMVEQLELDLSGRYRCRKCMSAHTRVRSGQSAPSSPVDSLDATAMIAYWMDGALSQTALSQAAAYYRSTSALPLRWGGTDALLYAVARRQASEDEALFRQALERSVSLHEDPRLELGALPSASAAGDEMKGAMCASSAIAALLTALF